MTKDDQYQYLDKDGKLQIDKSLDGRFILRKEQKVS